MDFNRMKKEELIDCYLELKGQISNLQAEKIKIRIELEQIIERLRGAGNGLTY